MKEKLFFISLACILSGMIIYLLGGLIFSSRPVIVKETNDYTTEGEDTEITAKEEANSGTIEITNKYTPKETQITVKKIWDDNSDQDGKRAKAEAKVILQANGQDVSGSEKTVGTTEDT